MKYRVWNNATKRFLRTSTYINSDGNLYKDNDPYGLDMSGKRSISPMPNCTVMRSTGLHDKNGTPIFEGDVVLTYMGNICEIRWAFVSESSEHQDYEYTGFCFHHLKQNRNYHLDVTSSCEVIGNIHENPELL